MDYWDHATLLEIAIIEKDYLKLDQYLTNIVSLTPVPEPWQIETTARNIKMIAGAREQRKENTDNEKMALEELANFK